MKGKLHRIRTRGRRKRLEAVLAVTMRLVHETAAALDSAARLMPEGDGRDVLHEMAVRRRIDRLMVEELAAGMNPGQSAPTPAPDGHPHADIGRVARMNSVDEIYGVTRRQTEAHIHQLQRLYVMDESEYVREKIGFPIRVKEDFVRTLDTCFVPGADPGAATGAGDPFVPGEASGVYVPHRAVRRRIGENVSLQ